MNVASMRACRPSRLLFRCDRCVRKSWSPWAAPHRPTATASARISSSSPTRICAVRDVAQAASGPTPAHVFDGSTGGEEEGQHRQDLNLVLVHPQIPQNAGNVARTAAATGVALHLVEPLGFQVDDKKLKRAGLDYWPYVVVKVHPSWQAFHDYFDGLDKPRRLIAFSKFGTACYTTPGTYEPGDWLMFGSEIDGLPDEAHQAAVVSGGGVVKIPMRQTHVRSLNFSVSVGVGVYEAIRQLDSV